MPSKVNCTNCGKRFDYELYGGTCPKCGTIYRMTSSASTHSYIRPSEEHTETATKTPVRRYTQQNASVTKRTPIIADGHKPNQAKPARNTASIIAIIITLVVALFSLFASIADSSYFQDITDQIVELFRDDPGYQSLSTLPKAKDLKLGDSFSYQGEATDYQISLDDTTWITKADYKLPTGYALLTVPYTVSYDENDGQDYLKDFLLLSVYVQTKTGEYLSPINTYDLQNITGYSDEKLEELHIYNTIQYTHGYLYYFVKTDDLAGFYITCGTADTADAYEATDLCDAYEIALDDSFQVHRLTESEQKEGDGTSVYPLSATQGKAIATDDHVMELADIIPDQDQVYYQIDLTLANLSAKDHNVIYLSATDQDEEYLSCDVANYYGSLSQDFQDLCYNDVIPAGVKRIYPCILSHYAEKDWSLRGVNITVPDYESDQSTIFTTSW